MVTFFGMRPIERVFSLNRNELFAGIGVVYFGLILALLAMVTMAGKIRR